MSDWHRAIHIENLLWSNPWLLRQQHTRCLLLFKYGYTDQILKILLLRAGNSLFYAL